LPLVHLAADSWLVYDDPKSGIMAIGVHGQWIYIDRNHKVAIVKVRSMSKSKDTCLDGYNLEGFYGVVRYPSKK